jgi:hypothetical protein
MVIYPMVALAAALMTERRHLVGPPPIVTCGSTELGSRECSLYGFDMTTSNDEEMTVTSTQGCSAPT